jgi:hypothetical protein
MDEQALGQTARAWGLKISGQAEHDSPPAR